AVQAGCGVGPLDPQLPEATLAGPPVAVRVLQAVHHLLVGGLEAPALVAVIALRLLENRSAVLLAVDGALHPGHRGAPFVVGGGGGKSWCGASVGCLAARPGSDRG